MFCPCAFYLHPTSWYGKCLKLKMLQHTLKGHCCRVTCTHKNTLEHGSERSLNHLKRPFRFHHAHFVWFPPVLHQLLQTELVLQLPVQIVLEALTCSHGSSATEGKPHMRRALQRAVEAGKALYLGLYEKKDSEEVAAKMSPRPNSESAVLSVSLPPSEEPTNQVN